MILGDKPLISEVLLSQGQRWRSTPFKLGAAVRVGGSVWAPHAVERSGGGSGPDLSVVPRPAAARGR
jgi:hypothetical protein